MIRGIWLLVLFPSALFATKINGVNLVSPKSKFPTNWKSLANVSANWVSINPFIILDPNNPVIPYPREDNFWGDRPENIQPIVNKAISEGYKILLKPMFRVDNISWAGNYCFDHFDQYVFEREFSAKILMLAEIAEKEKIQMFSVGAELKLFVEKRPQFWLKLIKQIREVYSGQLTYAANWDNVQNIPFWEELDYIGVDAYYPLSSKKTPQIKELTQAWKLPLQQLKQLHDIYQKPILFTEFGYRSINYATWKQWEFESTSANSDVNLKAQVNGYEALFQSLWKNDWFAGGFLWKWFVDRPNFGGHNHSDYSPQNKPVIQNIKKWYSN